MTIRDIDCRDFDAERMARDFRDMGVTFFSFFAGGYVSTYPSKLPEARVSPFLGPRDITKDVVEAAHRYGIKSIAMADLSALPPAAFALHPDWASVGSDGRPYESLSGMYTACVMGEYAGKFGRAMVKEILDNYDVDAMKFGGGSYGFHGRICHCENCQKSYEGMYHEPLPLEKNWDDPHWLRYHRWRMSKTTERVKFLRDMVSGVKPGLPVMGNGVCFAQVDWTLNSALDIEEMARYQDMVQIEAQDRYSMNPDLSGRWQSVTWTAEEANYMTSVTDKPIWVVVSYFKAWPWRRSAMEYAEQKAYLAQIIANGASPMVNLSGGPPAAHEDKRGFRAPSEIYSFLRRHSVYYDGDRSGANIALVFSQNSLVYYGKAQAQEKVVEALRGYEKALQERHIPFDILSEKVLTPMRLAGYKALILPCFACMAEETANVLREYVKAGGSVIATHETSLFNEYGQKREDFLLSDILMVKYAGKTGNVCGDEPAGYQNYCRLSKDHPMLEGLEDAGLLPVAGNYCAVTAAGSASVPLRLAHPFIVFPEGLSYTAEPDIGHPMAVAYEHAGGGRTAYFPGQLDRMHWAAGFPDISRLLANAVLWAVRGGVPAACDAPNTVGMTFRVQENRAMVHLVNLTGGNRYFQQIIPVHNISVQIKRDLFNGGMKAFALTDGRLLDIHEEGGYYTAILPELKDYEVVVWERVA